MVSLSDVCPTLSIPDRADDALTGSAFAHDVLGLIGGPREDRVLAELLTGNVPCFMRALKVISVTRGDRTAEYFVTPDYLCIGSDEDYVRFPMTPGTAQAVANAYGAFLPTRRMVNEIFEQAEVKLVGAPMGASNQMRTTSVLVGSNTKIQAALELANATVGQLVAGHKKDIVICRGLWLDKDGKPWGPNHVPRVAIYGWARTILKTWEVWQGLNSSSHDTAYEDYSHGARLVADCVLLDGVVHSFADLVMSQDTASFLSDEGPLPGCRYP